MKIYQRILTKEFYFIVRVVFQPGGIHKEEHYNFWKDELGAGDWVLKTLREGYEIPFSQTPVAYEERNNRSARENEEKVREIVLEMIELGIVQRLDYKPTCISPLGLVSKLKDGKMKHRLVWDASRHLNLISEKQKVKLTHLEKALELTNKHDYQVIFDLKSAYYHIKIKEQICQYLGASISQENGSPLYFIYKHLPFGLSSAVHAITKLWKPLVAYFTKRGIRFSIYIDDGRILAPTKEEAVKAMNLVYNVVAKAGWVLELDKSDKEDDISKVKEYLGFIINTESMRVFATEAKLAKMRELLEETLTCESISVKTLARVLGKLVSLKPSHGSSVLICSKSSYACLEKAVENSGWRSKNILSLSEESRRELKFFLDNLTFLNGHLIQSELNAIRVDSLLRNPVAKTETIPFFEGPIDGIMVSDASEKKIFVYNLTKRGEVVLSVNLSQQEQLFSSGHRELLAILRTLQTWRADSSMTRMQMFWITDSENVVAMITKGSSKQHIQNMSFEIVFLLRKLDLTIIPIHLRREDPRIQLADAGSKFQDSDNWSVDAKSFSDLQNTFCFDFDLFADSNNAKLARFATLFFEPRGEVIDAFSANWEDLGMLWICPPVNNLIQIARRIMNCRCKGAILIPNWPTSNFLFFYLNEKAPFRIEKFLRPYIIQNENARNTPLFGFTSFDFILLSFNTFN